MYTAGLCNEFYTTSGGGCWHKYISSVCLCVCVCVCVCLACCTVPLLVHLVMVVMVQQFLCKSHNGSNSQLAGPWISNTSVAVETNGLSMVWSVK